MDSLDTASRHTAPMPLLDEMTSRLQASWSVLEASKIAAYAASHLCAGSSGALYLLRDQQLIAASVWGDATAIERVLEPAQVPAVQQRAAVLDDAPRTDPQALPPSYDLPLLDGGTCYGVLHLRGASPDADNPINPPIIPAAWLLPISIFARHLAATLARFARQDGRLAAAIAHATRTAQPLTLLLVKPQHLARLDRQVGTAHGDALLDQLVTHATGLVAGTGEAWQLRRGVLLVLLPATDAATAQTYTAAMQAYATALSPAVPLASGAILARAGRTAADLLQAAEEALLRAEIAGDGALVFA